MDVNWRDVILAIRRTHKWPRKTIAARVGASEISIYNWQSGKHEPRYSQGVELLRLAGMI